MYKTISGSNHNLQDTSAFVQQLDHLADYLPELWPLFRSDSEVIISRAPGRLDVMGGIADYSGSLVLQLPIANATHVALQLQTEPVLRIVSLPNASPKPEAGPRIFEMSLSDFVAAGKPIEYEVARSRFNPEGSHRWAAYVAGALLVLMRERAIEFKQGAHILVSSDVPEGAGVSSSAALEVATMQALMVACRIEIAPRHLALLCQKVENLVAGAPCGVMDQMTAACGENGELLVLLCQPDELKGTVKLPAELEVWGIDSGIRHSVGGGGYGRVRTAAFMGYRIIAEAAGLNCSKSKTPGKVQITDQKFGGYLANISPEDFELQYAPLLPQSMCGKEFLERYQGITDPVTFVDPNQDYPVLTATRHPIYEHARVKTFLETLQHWRGMNQVGLLGDLMYQSHLSYSSCGLGSQGTDTLVRLVRQAGNPAGLFGAKITGGGSGGTVAVLGRRGANGSVDSVAVEYEQKTGLRPRLITGSSAGAARFGSLRIMQSQV